MAAWVYIASALLSIPLSVLVIHIATRMASTRAHVENTPNHAARFLFRADRLIDQNLKELSGDPLEMPDIKTWCDFRNWMAGRFGTLPQSLDQIATQSNEVFKEENGQATLEIRGNGRGHHVILRDPLSHSPSVRHQEIRQNTHRHIEQATLDSAPCAILQISKSLRMRKENALWKTFSDDQKAVLDQAITKISELDVEPPLQINLNQSAPQKWIRLFAHDSGDMQSYYAIDITELIDAKDAQRAFLQTLTKTFANLSTGLCVFDRDHKLVLFNPSLVKLSQLPIDFLSARPTLMCFFDKLRDLQMMPEPKNYAAWRIQINQMIASAIGGSYDETWSLPNGLTYRITGRPHPDGAVAFLIENITDEVVLARRYRKQIDLRQAALDSLDDAIAIFSPARALLFCNTSLAHLIACDPDQSAAEFSLSDLIDRCKATTPYVHGWANVEDRLSEKSEVPTFSSTVHGNDGSRLTCNVSALSGNLTMLRLSVLQNTDSKSQAFEMV